MKNKAVAQLLRDIADFLEMQDVAYKPQAYRKAARSVETLTDPVEEYHEDDRLQEIDGVGEHIADKIAEYLETGELEYYEELKQEVPVDVEALTAVEGLGPKRVKKLYDALGITTLDELEDAAEAGDIAEVEGFGETSQENILDHIALARKGEERMLLGAVFPLVAELEDAIAATGAFNQVEAAGSFRRRKPTIGDVDVLATADDHAAAMDAFCSLPGVTAVLSRGETKSSVMLDDTVQVDLRIVDASSWGAALLYFTGSKDHNVALRKRAQQRDWMLNEYGVMEDGEAVAAETEDAVYDALGLAFIPPELRENTGEVDAAADGTLPDLVARDDVRGDLQMHTTWSDGDASIGEMAEAAAREGHDYILVTDHGPTLPVVDGIKTVEELEEQQAEIAAVNEEMDIDVLHGIETDITGDGLGVPDEMVDIVDLVVASIHTKPAHPTDAVVTAFQDGADIWGHPTNRKIHEREPNRLDLDWQHVKEYRGTVDFVVSTDAHSPQELGFMHLGVAQARRGWLEAGDVLNTRKKDGLLAFFD
ncbi:MAG: helix-hairpin-helix domain-containing protein [Candidatus Nanohaloarchaea archaeon]|nr:helix-hairpin-helix domain-containing protein [Candidatus Nanohaloarchaea archaeon]